MRKFLARNIAMPLNDLLLSKSTISYLKEFRKFKYASRHEIESHQLFKLKKLLVHANCHSPFYKSRFEDYNFKPELISKVDDLKKIPPLTREDLQLNWQNIVSENSDLKKLARGSSSGSTGKPVTYYKDRLAESAGQAAFMFGWEIGGWQLGSRGIHIWGNPTTVHTEWNRLGSKLKAYMYNHRKFPAYQLTDEGKFKTLFDLINSKKHEFIDGYTNAIYLFACYLEDNNLHLKNKLNHVFTTAENLQDFQQKYIEKHLGPVYDSYGCSEINGVANQCKECGNYHIIEPHVLVERGPVQDENGSTLLYLTDLDNLAFPLIRYQVDDLAVFPSKDKGSECKCNFIEVEKIIGRQSDIIQLPDGGTLTVPSFFGSMLLKKLNGIKHYQIIREDLNLLHINLVLENEFTDQEMIVLEREVDKYLGSRINYKINIVDSIPVSDSGKFKLLIDKTKC